MAAVTLDDGQAQVEVAVFNELYEAHRTLIKEDALLIIIGKASSDSYSGGMRVTADEIMDLDGARTRYATGLRLTLADTPDARKLIDGLAPHRLQSGCPVSLVYRNETATCDVLLGSAWRVRLSDDLFAALGGFGRVDVGYAVVLKAGRDRERAAA
jgi:DNA polymerase-3 subunit alpha